MSPEGGDTVYYWLLPERFLGNRAESYGGNMTLVVGSSSGSGRRMRDVPNVVLVGNGVSVHWTDADPTPWTPDQDRVSFKLQTVTRLSHIFQKHIFE